MVTFVTVSPRGLSRLPSGSVVKNPPADAGDARDAAFHPWVRKVHWGRRWQPTPVFLPGKSHGQRSLAGYIVHRVAKSQTQVSNRAHPQEVLVIARLTEVNLGSGWSPGFKEGCLHWLPTQLSKMINQKVTQVLKRSSSPHHYLRDQDKNNNTHFTREDTAAWKRQVTHSWSMSGLGQCPRDDLQLHSKGVFYNGSLKKRGAIMLVPDDIAACPLVPQE